MAGSREEALQIVTEMISPQVATIMDSAATSDSFGAHLATLALENVFGALWTRPGLNRRDRSLLTLGILIALRASGELSIHIPAALNNGVTKEELAEVIYHASAYAGFPAASAALALARPSFPEAKAE
jgi:4-carboxymuconolactone decarboxylase